MFPLSDDENPTRTYPVINHLLIFANIIAFVAQYLFLSRDGVAGLPFNEFACVPARFVAHFSFEQVGTLFSAMFMHAGFAHILGNLWYLYIFGDNIEDRMGHTNYLLFYLTCGVLAGLAHILTNPFSAIPCVGASGAISGVLGAYLVMFPGVRVHTWVTWYFRPMVSAWVLIGFWFVMQVISSYFDHGAGAGTAWFAHIGGFVGGILLLKICLKKETTKFGPAETNMPMPTFITVSIVIYGLAAMWFSMYKQHALPYSREQNSAPVAVTAPVPLAHAAKAVEKKTVKHTVKSSKRSVKTSQSGKPPNSSR